MPQLYILTKDKEGRFAPTSTYEVSREKDPEKGEVVICGGSSEMRIPIADVFYDPDSALVEARRRNKELR